MRRVDHGDAALAERVDGFKQRGDLVVGERGRRFIHQDDVGLAGQGLGDLDHLHLRHGEAAHRLVGVQVRVQSL